MDRLFEKNILYPDFKDAETQRRIRDMVTWEEQQANVALIYMMTMMVQTVRGTQLVVSKELSDELDEVDLQNFKAEDLIIMFDSMEVYFEDPALPTVLWFVKNAEYRALCTKYLDADYRTASMDHYGFEYYTRDGMGFTCQLGPELVESWLTGTSLPVLPGQKQSDPDEEAFQRKMFLMLAKLFTYCSIPQYKPVAVSRNQLHCGGKAGVRNRPQRPAYRVTVPSVVHERKAVVEHAGRVVAAHRRRGYLRKLVSERYRAKKGTVIYIRPCMVHGGTVSDRVYVAVKRKETENGQVRESSGGNPNLAGAVSSSDGQLQVRAGVVEPDGKR